MNLQEKVSKILGYEVTKEGAMEFADKQFGLLATYLRENPYKEPNKYDNVTQELIVLQINEDAIIHDIIQELIGYEAFVDKTGVNDIFYQGDVFDTLITNLRFMSPKVLIQLKELAKLSKNYDYIQVINRK